MKASKNMEQLIEIFKNSGTDYKVKTDLATEFEATFSNKYKFSIEALDGEEVGLDDEEFVYCIVIGCINEDDQEISDAEYLIAKAAWFITSSLLNIHVVDMPDGFNVCLTVTVK